MKLQKAKKVVIKYNSYRLTYLWMSRFFPLTKETTEGGRVVIDSEDKKAVKKSS